MQLNGLIPDLLSDDFFSLLHINLADHAILENSEQYQTPLASVIKSSESKNDQKITTDLKFGKNFNDLEGQLNQGKENDHFITDATKHKFAKNQSDEEYNSIEPLLNYLHSGILPLSVNSNAMQVVMKDVRSLSSKTNPDEIQLLFLTLKQEAAVNRLFTGFTEHEKEKIIKHLFPEEYTFLKDHLYDFQQFLQIEVVKNKFNFEPSALIKPTLMYFLEYSKKMIRVSDYVHFIAKQLFKNHNSYVTFSNLVKISLLKNELKPRTFLSSILDNVSQREKKEERILEKEKKKKEDTVPKHDVIFIENAGLVLLWPFFSFYFQTLHLTKDNKFVSEKAAARAAHLLEYLVTGHKKNTEHTMMLNKLLCNLPRNFPIDGPIKIRKKEISLSKELLEIAISRWEIIKNSSIDGLRESFLKRPGKLEWDEGKIYLRVESKGYDMLLDKIPWNISVVKLAWMKNPIYVKWR